MRRVKTPVTLEQARERLVEYRNNHKYPDGLFKANALAQVIWPDTYWPSSQGAGAAATRVLKKLGAHWRAEGEEWGWRISTL